MLDPIAIGEGINEGIAGNIDPNAGINTPLGYLFVDRPAKKLYLFDGKTPKLISKGIEKLLFENIDFCNISDCHDEKTADGTYYSIGYDPIFKRILFTKKDTTDNKSFTLSYSAEDDKWISLHDYLPQAYFFDRRNMYSIKDNDIYRHNANDGTYRNFYGKDYAAEIECVAIDDAESFMYKDTFINAEAEKGQVKNIDKTFNKIAMYNTTQGTGTKDAKVFGDNKDTRLTPSLITEDSDIIKLHKKRRGFAFNNAMDAVNRGCAEQAMTNKEECVLIETINESKFGVMPKTSRTDNGKVIVDDHLIYRLTYDQDKETQIRLLSIKTNEQKEIR